MLGDGGNQKEVLRPDFNRSILVDFRGARINSNTGFLLLREMDERFDIIGPMSDCLEDRRSSVRTRVSYHAKKWHVHVASAFPLAHHYRAVFGYV